MKKMKTITVNGSAYTVEDPCAVSFEEEQRLPEGKKKLARDNIGAASIDNSKIGPDAWSSKNIIDKLCPSFTESGSIVTCEPVEGYPLEVSVQGVSNPNLIPSDAEWPLDEIYDSPAYEIGYLPSGVYTLYSTVDSIDVQAHNAPTDEWISVLSAPNDAGSAQTFEHIGGTLRVVDLNFNITSEDFFVKLEAGTEYTGTNYSNTTITRCGKNVFGGNALVDALKRTDLGGGVTVDEANKTVTFDANLMNRSDYPFTKFKENTQYTFLFYGYNTATAGVTNMRVVYTDGSTDYFYFGSITKPTPVNEAGYIYHKTQAGKTVDYLRLSLQSGLVVLYYDQCGVFEGDVPLEDFEAYKTETLFFGEPIYAWSGVNTLWADTGDITVQGKSDPVAIINKLTNAIIATGGNV